MIAKCEECGRVFDWLDPDDASEWSFGHDCEATDSMKPHYPSPREIDAMRQAGHRRYPGVQHVFFGMGAGSVDMHPVRIHTWVDERKLGIPSRWREAERRA